jgi:hypothetical protein
MKIRVLQARTPEGRVNQDEKRIVSGESSWHEEKNQTEARGQAAHAPVGNPRCASTKPSTWARSIWSVRCSSRSGRWWTKNGRQKRNRRRLSCSTGERSRAEKIFERGTKNRNRETGNRNTRALESTERHPPPTTQQENKERQKSSC